jgi:hypothetical protein
MDLCPSFFSGSVQEVRTSISTPPTAFSDSGYFAEDRGGFIDGMKLSSTFLQCCIQPLSCAMQVQAAIERAGKPEGCGLRFEVQKEI